MGVAAYRFGKKAVRAAHSVVNFTALVLAVVLVGIGCYALWDAEQIYNAADAQAYALYKPSVEDEGASFEELQRVNEDVFSWLTVYGTHIDYPVLQGKDNMQYVSLDAKGDYAGTGSIFLDSSNNRDFSDFNSILYGHHMEREAMFGEIERFSDKTFFDERRYGNLYYDGKDHGLEFFAFLHTNADDTSVFSSAVSETMQQSYLEGLLTKARHTRDIRVTTEDRIVLLSTCSAESTHGRDILIGRITDAPFEDVFFHLETTDDTVTGAIAQIGRAGPWRTVLAVILVVIALVVLVILVRRYIRNKKKRLLINENGEANTQEQKKE